MKWRIRRIFNLTTCVIFRFHNLKLPYQILTFPALSPLRLCVSGESDSHLVVKIYYMEDMSHPSSSLLSKLLILCSPPILRNPP